MAFIVQRLTKFRLQLGREELVRPMSFGSRWQSLRIALLCTVSGGAGTFSNAAYAATGFHPLCIGLCQGTVGLNDSTVDAIYGSPTTTTTSTWDYTSGVNNYYLPNPAGISVFQKFGGAITALGNSSNQSGIFAGGTENYLAATFRMPLNLDIVKNALTSPAATYAFSLYMPTVAQIGDLSEDTWYDRIQTFGAMTNTTLTGTLAAAAVSGNMLHDNVFIRWNRFTPTFEIAAWAVIRFG